MTENPDEVVERLLAGLRTAEPPASMERRILRAIEQYESAVPQARLRVRRAISGRLLIGGIALSAALAVVTVVTTIHHRGGSPVDAPTRTASIPEPSGTASARAPRLDPLASVDGLKPHKGVHEPSRRSVRSRTREEASFPAPPMPLTEQEKLLLKLAHQGDPEELAMIIHQGAAVESAEEKADFSSFFGQPDKGDHE